MGQTNICCICGECPPMMITSSSEGFKYYCIDHMPKQDIPILNESIVIDDILIGDIDE